MMNISTKLWQVKALNGWQIAIIQRATGMLKVFSRTALPDDTTLAMISENRFNTLCREAFHG
jgi:hypothetical protein